MLFPSPGAPGGPRVLLILNHRGEPLADLRTWFQDRGWQVLTSRDLEKSLELLKRQEFAAAVVAPLTLRPDTLEWECLLEQLSPHRKIPWLVVPWAEASAGSVGSLLRGLDALADWVTPPLSLPETETRLENLLRLEALLSATRTHAAALEGQLIQDHKTCLHNERHFRARLKEEFRRSERHDMPLSLILLDVDDFKRINDTTSYEFGDLALRTVGDVLHDQVRSIDIAARLGGDEYAIALPNTTLQEAVVVARRIEAGVRAVLVQNADHRATLQVSLGVATFAGRGNLKEPQQLINRANEALKEAKREGKGRVRFHDGRERRRKRGDSDAAEPDAGDPEPREPAREVSETGNEGE